MIISKPHLCTHIPVWTPKYNRDSLVGDYSDLPDDEWVALLHKNKVDFGSPILIVEFPKAKHLQGGRYAIRKDYAQKHTIGTNGAAQMYEIPRSHFDSYETAQEVYDIANNLFLD